MEIRVLVPLTLKQEEKDKQKRDDNKEVEGEINPEDLKYVKSDQTGL